MLVLALAEVAAAQDARAAPSAGDASDPGDGGDSGDLDDLDELSLEELMNVDVVSASKQPQSSLTAPAKIVILTRRDLELRGYMDLEEVLHDLAGFDFEKGQGVHWSQIYMRGERSTNSDRFLFIWDGMVENDIWAQVTWFERQFPLSNIERIEIMYGPASLLYGSNAVSGIINVITRKPEDVDGGSAEVRYGWFNTLIAEANFGKRWGDFRASWTGRLLTTDERDLGGEYWIDNGGRRRYYGLRDPEDYDLAALAAAGDYDPATGRLRIVKNGAAQAFSGGFGSDTLNWFAEAGVGWRGFQLEAQGWYRGEMQDGWVVPLASLQAPWNAYAWSLRATHEAGFERWWTSRAHLTLRETGIDPSSHEPAFAQDRAFSASDPTLPRVSRLTPPTYYRLHNGELRAGELLTYRKRSRLLTAGAEVTLTRVMESYETREVDTQPWTHSPRHDERNLAVYASAQADPTRHTSLSIGARWEHNAEIGGDGGFGHLLTARAAAIWKPAERQAVKLIYGQAFQAPQPFQKYSTIPNRPLPAPNLNPERLQSLELGYELEAWHGLRASLNLYWNRIDDKIQLTPQPDGTNRFADGGRVEIIGSEAEARYFWNARSSAYVNLTASDARDLAGQRSTGGIAPVQAQLGADLRVGRHLGVSLRGHAVARRRTARWDSDSLLTVHSVAPYATVDATLTWFDLWPRLDARLSVYNLTDTRYFDPGVRSADGSYYNGAVLQLPLRAYLGLGYRF